MQIPDVLAGEKRAANKYRRLKQMASDIDNHELELKYFRYELQALSRSSKKWSSRRFFTSLYGKLSNYGESFERPFIYLIITLFIFAVFYFFISDRDALYFSLYDIICNSLLFSLSNILLIFGGDISQIGVALFGENMPRKVSVLSIIQNIISKNSLKFRF